MPKRKRTRSVLRRTASVPTPTAEQAPTHVIIDGLEGDKARVELPDGTTADWDRASLPADAKEGDVIRIQGVGQEQMFEIDAAETDARRQQAQRDLDALNAAQPTGEINL